MTTMSMVLLACPLVFLLIRQTVSVTLGVDQQALAELINSEIPNGAHPSLNIYSSCGKLTSDPQSIPDCVEFIEGNRLGYIWNADGFELDSFGRNFKYHYELCLVGKVCDGPAYWNGGMIATSDPDGDGISSGIELGDPCGRWEKGMLPARNFSLSDPGERQDVIKLEPTTMDGIQNKLRSTWTPEQIINACDCSLSDAELDAVGICLPRWPTAPPETPAPSLQRATTLPTPRPSTPQTPIPTPGPTAAPDPDQPKWTCANRALCSILKPRTCCGDERKLGNGSDVMCGYEACMEFYCAAGVNSPTPGAALPPFSCVEPRPIIADPKYNIPCGENCSGPPQPCQWRPSEWTTCSAKCGEGTRTRSLTCMNVQEGGSCPDLLCGGGPSVKQSCTLGPCPTPEPVTLDPTGPPTPPTPAPTPTPTTPGEIPGVSRMPTPPTLPPTWTPISTFAPEEPKFEECIVEAWSEWDSCSQVLDDGSCCGDCVARRFRQVYWLQLNLGFSCPAGMDKRPCDTCDQDCKLTQWTAWQKCAAWTEWADGIGIVPGPECGAPGTKTRFRTVERPAVGEGTCDDASRDTVRHESVECQLDACRPGQDTGPNCTTLWGQWSECTGTCASSNRVRSRSILPAEVANPQCVGVSQLEEQPDCLEGCNRGVGVLDACLFRATDVRRQATCSQMVIQGSLEHKGQQGRQLTQAQRNAIKDRIVACGKFRDDQVQVTDTAAILVFIELTGVQQSDAEAVLAALSSGTLVPLTDVLIKFPFFLKECGGTCPANAFYQEYLRQYNDQSGAWVARFADLGTVKFEEKAERVATGTKISVRLTSARLPDGDITWEVFEAEGDIGTTNEECDAALGRIWNPRSGSYPCARPRPTDVCSCAYGDLKGRHTPLYKELARSDFVDCCLPIKGQDGIDGKVLVLKNAGNIIACARIEAEATAPISAAGPGSTRLGLLLTGMLAAALALYI